MYRHLNVILLSSGKACTCMYLQCILIVLKQVKCVFVLLFHSLHVQCRMCDSKKRKVDLCTSICNIHVRTVYLSSVLSSSDNLTLQLSVTPLMNKLMEIVATKHRSHSTCACEC